MIHVRAALHTYDVHVAPGLLARAGEYLLQIGASGRVHVISDAAVADPWGVRLDTSLRSAGFQVSRGVVPSGEGSKCLAEYGRLLNELATINFPRDGTIIGLGGGVTGDLAGFVAASYHRGVRFVQAPTSLLAMVDSSVGGKTGINLAAGKNLVGAFWPPAIVLADTQCLDTLPLEELRSGMAEVVKAGIIADPVLFTNLERAGGLVQDHDLVDAILRSIAVKAGIVTRDEREQGERRHLNLGHTIGHAIEAESHYAVRHGDAVAIGLVVEARIAAHRGILSRADAARIREVLHAVELPLQPPAGMDPAAILARTAGDKKVRAGKVHYVLPEAIGHVRVVSDVAPDEVLAALGG